MCVAIVKPSGSPLPKREILKVCFKNNPDGAGFAYNRNGRNYIHKGYFTFADFYDALIKCRIRKEESALIHFRVATHGNIDKKTCHPFLITGCFDDMKLTHIKTYGNVMIHNGMLSFYLNDETISDSMMLAKQLYKLDLNKEENRTFIELALRNNDKNKINRLAILYADNTTDLFGFKEPWDLVDGCYFSNKSYEKTFTRGYKSIINNSEDKFNYDENEIQSKKVSFCYNHDHGCNNLGIYCVNNTKKDFDFYCEDCINSVQYFNCKVCGNSYYIDKKSKIKNICKECYEENKEFIEQSKCSCNTNTFVCPECEKTFEKSRESNIKYLCNSCYEKNKYNECLYCKTKENLIRTNFSTVCEKCFKEKNGSTCFTCGKKFIYGDNKINNLRFCSKCFSTNTFNVEKVLEYFKSFSMLDVNSRNKIITKMKLSTEDIQQKVIELYKNNNNFSSIKSNYIDAMKIFENSLIEKVKK